MPKRRSRKKKTPANHARTIRIGTSVVLLLVGLLSALGIFGQGGVIGAGIYGALGGGFGIGGVVVTLLVLAIGGHNLFREASRLPFILLGGVLIALLGLIGFLSLLAGDATLGGTIGAGIAGAISNLVGAIVAGIVLLGASVLTIYGLVRNYFGHRFEDEDDERITIHTESGTKELSLRDDTEEDAPAKDTTKEIPIVGMGKPRSTKKPEDTLEIIEPSRPVIQSDYINPPLKLFKQYTEKPNTGNIKENVQIIKRTMGTFDIHVEMDEVTVGPTVTRYALTPPPGVRLDRIVALQKNLELALAAHPVRIEAPIPGKSLVGIEIPNKKKSTIGLGTMFQAPEFIKSDKPLLVSLGKDVAGASCFANLAKLPHLLIAGATGAGKSVTVHNIITSLLYRNGPEDLRLIMVDPKRVELTLYNRIPHLLTPVIKTPKKAILALKWAVKEMERRYDALEKNAVRDIQSYHDSIVKPAYKDIDFENTDEEVLKALPERMPYIVVIIDELADIMQAYPKELESGIVRLAQMSRAVGIHLILSTQRPSKKVVTGLIKANIPGRIALRVASNIDSRVILDASGAEKLLGAGDMLFIGDSINTPKRMQSAYIDENEVKKVAEYIAKHNVSLVTDEIMLPDPEDDRTLSAGSFDSAGGEDEDPMYEEARAVVIEAGKASTSYLQRRLRVGYSRAARLMDSLEDNGVIGPQDGSKPRQVLIEQEIPESFDTDEASAQEDSYDEGED